MRPRNLYAARIPRVLHDLKAIMASPSGGRGGGVSGGVFDHGTHEEDGPGTWEALASPRHIPASRRAGDRLRRTTRLQGHVSPATRHRTSTCIEVGYWQGEPEPWLMGAGRRRAA